MPFQVGDVVHLKSGGPKMTVTYVGDDSGRVIAHCEWFADRKPDEKSFPQDALQKAVDV